MKLKETIDGRYLLLRVGRKYDSRTLGFAIERALNGEPLNGQQRLVFTSLLVQLTDHRENEWRRADGLSLRPARKFGKAVLRETDRPEIPAKPRRVNVVER